MATSTLQDNEILSGLFKDAFAPITNYSQGLLTLAVQRKQRELQKADEAKARSQQIADEIRKRGYQVEDITRSEKFQIQRDVDARIARQADESSRQGFELSKQEIANQQLIERQKAEYQLLSDEKKKLRFDEEKDKALANGIKLGPNATYEDAITANAGAHGQKITAAMGALKDISTELAMARGQTQEELRKEQMGLAIGTLDAKTKAKLSPTDMLALINDPAEMGKLLERAKTANNRDLLQTLANIQGNVMSVSNAMLDKTFSDKTRVQDLKDRQNTASTVLKFLLTNDKYPVGTIVDAFKGYAQAAHPPQSGPPAPNGAPLPPPGNNPNQAPGSPGDITKDPRYVKGIFPAAGDAISGAVGKVQGAVAPYFDAASKAAQYPLSAAKAQLFSGLMPETPNFPAVSDRTKSIAGAVLNPPSAIWKFIANKIASGQALSPQEVDTAKRLQTSLQQQGATQNAIAPTAFPPAQAPGLFDEEMIGLNPP